MRDAFCSKGTKIKSNKLLKDTRSNSADFVETQ